MTDGPDHTTTITLRPATRDDSADLYAWRNDPDTRANSRNTNAVFRSGHKAWLEATLANPARRIWIAERGGRKLGTVSAVRGDDGAVELSITVAPAERGRGAAGGIIQRALEEVAALWPEAPVGATVRVENAASRRLFERCGFVQVAANEKFVEYRLVRHG